MAEGSMEIARRIEIRRQENADQRFHEIFCHQPNSRWQDCNRCVLITLQLKHRQLFNQAEEKLK